MRTLHIMADVPRKAATGIALDFVHQQRDQRASWLDRTASFELFLGHHAAAERLAHKAAEIREMAP